MEEKKFVQESKVVDWTASCFPTIPMWKVLVLSIATFGLWDMIWAYKLWKTLKVDYGYKVCPIIRVIFLTITNFFLFPTMDKYAKSYGIKIFAPILLAVWYIIVVIAGNAAPDYWWMLTFVSVFSLVPVQAAINEVNEKFHPDAPVSKWTTANTIWTVVCIIIHLFAFIPD